MRHSRLLQFFLLALLCLTISGLAEAGDVSPLAHPEQFPYPSNDAQYSDSKTGCAIQAFENGAFDVYFRNGLSSSSVYPAICSNDVYGYLYDPTTMSNSSKKLSSTQTSYIEIGLGCSEYQIPTSSMTASADAKKSTVTVKISDSALQNEIYGPASIRTLVIDYASALSNAGFKLKNGTWSATCKAKRSIEH